MVVSVLSNQSIYDISIQVTGTADNAFLIAKANQIAVSDKLTNGQQLVIPNVITKDAKALQYYAARNIIPATGLNNRSQNQEIYGFPEGEFPFSF
jgi:hypothetical protein